MGETPPKLIIQKGLAEDIGKTQGKDEETEKRVREAQEETPPPLMDRTKILETAPHFSDTELVL